MTQNDEARRRAIMAILGSLVRLVRNAKVHKLSNDIFDGPLDRLSKAVRIMIDLEGRCHLQIDSENFYLNEMPAQIEVDWRPHLQALQAACKESQVGGFHTEHPVSKRHLKGVIIPFAQPGTPLDHPQLIDVLGPIKLLPYQQIDEHIKGKGAEMTEMRRINLGEVANLLDLGDENTGLQALRRVTETYARAVYFVTRVLDSVEADGPKVPLGLAAPIVQDLVDCAQEEWSSFLTLVVSRPPPKTYEPYHHATTTVLSIALATRLGLDRISQFEVGTAALFHNLAIVDVAELTTTEGVIDKERRAVLAELPLNNARRLIQARAPTYEIMQQVLAAYELKQPVSARSKRADGEIVTTPVRERPLLYSRIVSVAAHFDALTSPREFRKPMGASKALETMRKPMATRFDQVIVDALANLLNLD
ncbi:MAG: HD domain-containing phosphohydrolase [Myxococcota bacterium]|nr:HD domain-containing phosphohydrolase [Myxococcota bacterium]